MAHVRKITHPPRADGSRKISWRATWAGPDGDRQSKSFDTQRDAKAWLASVAAGLVGGSSQMTVVQMAEEHIAYFHGLVRSGDRRATTVNGYQSILDTHVKPHAIAKKRLSELRAPMIQALLDDIIKETGSTSTARRVRRSLVQWCRFAVRRGWLLANPAQACAVDGANGAPEGEPFELPSKDQLSAIVAAASLGDHHERDTAVVRILMFGGLRSSELLGLADDAAVLRPMGGKLRIRERLEYQHKTLDPPKTSKGRRDVPIGKEAALAIRAWRLKRGGAQPFGHVNGKREKAIVSGRLFPNPETGSGVWGYHDFIRDCWMPLMRRAGLVVMVPDSKGKNRPQAAFKPHMLRHVAVSLWLSQRPQPMPKKVQELVGHATLKMTMDTYGHLWRDDDEDDAIAQASERLIR